MNFELLLNAAPWAKIFTAIAVLVAFKMIFTALMSRWHMAKPNEWLLLLQNGVCTKAGIGMSCFCPPGAQVVRFPSTMQETTFTASQATKQRAGVSVTGKAYWSIYRPSAEDPDGPFRAFKSLTGLAEGNFTTGNEKVQTLAISTIRDAVSKMSIVEVMTSREELKARVKGDIEKIFRGWGMWLETVEILDVRVESSQLFDDMQYLRNNELDFDTKADAHLQAEKSKLIAQGLLDAERLEKSTDISKKRADADAEQGIYSSKQQLKREEGEANLEEARQRMRLERMAKEQEIALQAAADKAERENKAVEQELAVAKAREDQDHALKARQYELEQSLTPLNLQKAAIDATKEIYAKLPLREVKLVSLGGGNGDAAGGLATLLPQVAESWTAVSQ